MRRRPPSSHAIRSGGATPWCEEGGGRVEGSRIGTRYPSSVGEIDPSARYTLRQALVRVSLRARRPLTLREYVVCVDPLVPIHPTEIEVRACLEDLQITWARRDWAW